MQRNQNQVGNILLYLADRSFHMTKKMATLKLFETINNYIYQVLKERLRLVCTPVKVLCRSVSLVVLNRNSD